MIPNTPMTPVKSVLFTMILMTALLTFPAGCDQADPMVDEILRVSIGGRSFDLELAMSDATRVKGLSDRESIPTDGGMLFVFPQARPLSFVMRRCLVPIDIIYLDPAGRIVRTYAMQVEPYDTPESRLRRYDSGNTAQFAIELAGGTLDSLNLSLGQKIDLPVESLKQRAR